MKKVLVTGADGQLGKCLQDVVNQNPHTGFQFLFTDKEQFDLINFPMVESYFFTNEIDYLVNCAAYTAVDNAEKDAENAFKINADAVGLLARECFEQNATFIHISTDYVFDGMAHEPYTENDHTAPQGVYGKSKLEGERVAFDENPNSIVIRTSWVYSPYGHNFMKTMLRLFAEKDEISVVNDQEGTPTNAQDLAKVIFDIILSGNTKAGLYHYSNAGETTWYGFAHAIKEITQAHTQINPISTSAYPTPAKRPQYSVLDKSKIIHTFGVDVPEWRTSLKRVLEKGE